MSERVIIRRATAADLESMVELLAELFAIETDFAIDTVKQRKGLIILLRTRTASLWVAQHAQQIVGMVSAQLNISTAEGALSALLEDLFVRSEFRREGIGTRLLQAAINWAECKGAKRVQLLADQHNQRALEFYRNAGWSATHMTALRKGL